METPDSYQACLHGLYDIVPFEYAQYLIEAPENRDYKVVASIIPEGETGYDIAHRTGVIGQVFRTAKPIVVPDVRNHPLYDPFDVSIDWELCFPLLLEGKLIGVINLEGAGTLSISREVWCDISESVFKATQYMIPPSHPQRDDSWKLHTSRVVVVPDPDDDARTTVLTVARSLARDGNSTLLVGEYPSLRGSGANLDDVEDANVSVSSCCYGLEERLDLLAAGPRSKKTLAARTDWWQHCEGRYSFVVLEGV